MSDLQRLRRELGFGMINDIRFEKPNSWNAPHLYSEEEISDREAEIDAKFPKEFRAYMQTKGTLKIKRDHCYCLVKINEFNELLEYDNFVHEAFFVSEHKKYLSNCANFQFEFAKEKYFPFSELKQTGVTTKGKFILFLSMNPESYGTIWTAFDSYDDEDKLAYFIANSFGEFLAGLSTYRSYRDKAEEKNQTIFHQWVSDFEKSSPSATTSFFANTDDFIKTRQENPETIQINGARRLEYNRLQYCFEIKNEVEFIDKATSFCNYSTDFIAYSSVDNVKSLHEHDFPGLILLEHHFYKCFMSGKSLSGINCVEEIIFYKNPTTQQLSFITIHNTSYDLVKVKGLGTFNYDDEYTLWSLEKQKKPQWSAVPCALLIEDGNDLFSKSNMQFVRNLYNNERLKELIEKHVFDIYQKHHYPEYLAMDKEEQAECSDFFPEISKKNQIWVLLGEELRFIFNLKNKSLVIFSDYFADGGDEMEIQVCLDRKGDIV